MNNNDLDNFKQQLEELEKEVERLKKENPEDDYTELDDTIEKFRSMISEGNVSRFKRKIVRKRFLGLFLNYLFHLFTTLSILGFCIGFLNDEISKYIGIFIPVLALVIFIYRKFSSALIFNGPLKNHKILYTISLYFIFVAIIGIVDYFLLNIWTSIWNSIITLIILGFVLDLGEFIYYRKLVTKYKQGGK